MKKYLIIYIVLFLFCLTNCSMSKRIHKFDYSFTLTQKMNKSFCKMKEWIIDGDYFIFRQGCEVPIVQEFKFNKKDIHTTLKKFVLEGKIGFYGCRERSHIDGYIEVDIVIKVDRENIFKSVRIDECMLSSNLDSLIVLLNKYLDGSKIPKLPNPQNTNCPCEEFQNKRIFDKE